ncbi:GGDEF domain-containing protein [Streptomyces sp. ISL-11]|uniref:GGDEF domain-containing protein n=1 Tax=Streptomyces sp. ISL-11 TaxID=2819174 RepID=UPI001BE978E2|nr:GGDEF domain-containing protein [Streptomyces sp. ISL-11]MBT2382089.1 GGDEF domain-containing protein [Streptomyces sp. ISL-11]
MDTITSLSATAGPLLAGWSVHAALLRRRARQARFDPLTNLPGRDLFTRSACRDLRNVGAVVVMVDLNGFKDVNDNCGHAAGDAVLATVGARLQKWANLRKGTAGRLGGDEFAATALIPNPSALSNELGGLHFSLQRPVPFRGKELLVGASIGAHPIAFHAPALDVALRRADEAMYAAKRSGGGWQISYGPVPEMTTTNGRRTGRPGTAPRAGGAR